MFGGVSKAAFILVSLPALVQGIDIPRQPVIISKIFGFPAKLIFDSFIKSDLPRRYQKLSAKDKQDALWEQIVKDTTPGGYTPGPEMMKMFVRNMNDCFDTPSDERPWRGYKTIHSQGYHAKAKFDAAPGTPYTGLFKGCKNLIIRLAPSAKPSGSLFSGISAKFLVDGKPSQNILGFRKWSTMEQSKYPNDTGDDWIRWFDGDISTTPAPIPKPIPNFMLVPKFGTSSREPNHLGTKPVAEVDAQGNVVENPKVPFEVIFRPNKKLLPISLAKLGTVPSGTKLYDIYAKENDQDSPEQFIGSVTSTSELTTSMWGDRRLFFQHIRRDDELKKYFGTKCPYKPAMDQYNDYMKNRYGKQSFITSLFYR